MRIGSLTLILLGSCALPAFAQNPPAVPASVPSFVNEIEPILTRLGCNQGACHGKGAGQNGFRLSLRGYAPEWDHAWIIREFHGRRLNGVVPTDSLLLQKPTGEAPHAGGRLMTRESREYRTLLAWIEGGAPGVTKNDAKIVRIEVLPNHKVLKPGQTQQLTVRAEFSDGQSKDVTWLTQFVSNEAGVAEVSPTGLVKMARPGETSIRAMFLGQAAVAIMTGPFENTVAENLYKGRNNFIDDHVFKKLADLRIEPSEPAADAMFFRRAYLDTIGVLPTVEEVEAFQKDTRPDKRARWIDAILDRPEFVDYWTMLLADQMQNRKERDHDVRGTKGVRAFHEWLREQVASNRPWDELVRDVLTAKGSTHESPAVGYYIVNVGEFREGHRSPIGASVAQAFLGTRIGCAECHNHPLEKYTQDDFHHFAGFFSRVKLERHDPKMRATTLVVSTPDANQNKQPVGVTQPRTGKFLPPQPLDRQTMKVEPGQDPRQALADWITSPKNDYFAGAAVNRLWAHFFFNGLVEPIDDLRASNPPTNPELWNALTQEFVAKKFDRKHMIRLILNSRAYQLSSKTKPSNEKDQRFYSHYIARRLESEVLNDVICQTTGVPDRVDGYPEGLRAVQSPDMSVRSVFFGSISRPERVTACACEREAEINLPTSLFLTSSPFVTERIVSPAGRLAKLLQAKKSDEESLNELFLTTLARRPTSEEMSQIRTHLSREQDRKKAMEDIFWALLNTRNFLFNH